MTDCFLNEVFSAVQGEGPLVGVRQLFIRFSMCDLRCIWCDTRESLIRQDYCNVETKAGSRDFIQIKNPVTMNDLLFYLKNLDLLNHHSISITGGEPLLQYKFLENFLLQFKNQFKLPVYLETAGHKPHELKSVIKYVDYISMDIKLPSSSRNKELWDAHKKFLATSVSSNKEVWVKIVVTRDTSILDLFISVNLVKAICKNKKAVEIFLQPVTKIRDILPPTEKELLNMQSKLLEIYPYVRVVPQMHVLGGIK